MYLRRFYKTILCLIFITSCSLQQQTSELSIIRWEDLQTYPNSIETTCKEIKSIDSWESTKQDFTYGLAVGFFPEDLAFQNRIAFETYWVNPNEQLDLDWLFWYPEGNEESTSLRLFVLLNERQLEDALPDPGIYNDINLQPGDDKSIKVNIPPLSAGIHDVIAVGIPYPQNEPNAYGNVVVVSRRITLIAGTPPSPPFREIDFMSLPSEGSLKRNDPAMALELTLKKDGIDVWNWPHPWLDVKENTPVNFYALAGHQDVTNLDAPPLEPLKTSFSALLLFVDYQQVEIAPGQTALYARMDGDTAYARIPMTIHPLPPGQHHILVLRIDTPGVPMCILWGDSQSRILPNSVYGKLVGLIVQPAE